MANKLSQLEPDNDTVEAVARWLESKQGILWNAWTLARIWREEMAPHPADHRSPVGNWWGRFQDGNGVWWINNILTGEKRHATPEEVRRIRSGESMAEMFGTPKYGSAHDH